MEAPWLRLCWWILCKHTEKNVPWLVWLSGLSASLWTKRSPVQFPDGVHVWVVVPGPPLRACEKQPINVSLAHWCLSPSPSPSLPLSLINKIFKKRKNVNEVHNLQKECLDNSSDCIKTGTLCFTLVCRHCCRNRVFSKTFTMSSHNSSRLFQEEDIWKVLLGKLPQTRPTPPHKSGYCSVMHQQRQATFISPQQAWQNYAQKILVLFVIFPKG